jgi:hypothetical protein
LPAYHSFKIDLILQMEKIVREGSAKTPLVILDPEKGTISLEGRSILEDTFSFYEPILKWIADYTKLPQDTTINISLDYFNSTSARILLILFQTVKEIKKAGNKLTINWYYDVNDENIKESGMDFASLVKEEFNFIPKE